MKRWSKLQKRLYNLLDPELNIQIHCVSYPMHSQHGTTNIPRYYITLDKEIIWDYPKDFPAHRTSAPEEGNYPYVTDISAITQQIEEYIQTPIEELLAKHFSEDRWGLTDLLKAADRRISPGRVGILTKDGAIAVVKVAAARTALKKQAHADEKTGIK